MNKKTAAMGGSGFIFLFFLILGISNYRKDPGDNINLLCILMFGILTLVNLAGIIRAWHRSRSMD